MKKFLEKETFIMNERRSDLRPDLTKNEVSELHPVESILFRSENVAKLRIKKPLRWSY